MKPLVIGKGFEISSLIISLNFVATYVDILGIGFAFELR